MGLKWILKRVVWLSWAGENSPWLGPVQNLPAGLLLFNFCKSPEVGAGCAMTQGSTTLCRKYGRGARGVDSGQMEMLWLLLISDLLGKWENMSREALVIPFQVVPKYIGLLENSLIERWVMTYKQRPFRAGSPSC